MMRHRRPTRITTLSPLAVGTMGFVAGAVVLGLVMPPGEGVAPAAARWTSLLPPLLAIALAIITRHVFFSLVLAVAVGSLLHYTAPAIASPHAWADGLAAFGGLLVDTALDLGNLKVLAFLPLVFTLVELMMALGGFAGIMHAVLRWIRTRKAVQAATGALGLVCFIDDYANAVIVGSMMQPITDRYRVSREKLAFLVDATSAPVAGLAVVSTWIAYEVGLFNDVADKLQLNTTGYAMFFDALPFRFYCWLMIAFVFVHVLLGRDFGPMRTAERRAAAADEPPEPADEPDIAPAANDDVPRPRARNALIPLGGFLAFHFTGLWIDGGGPAKLTGAVDLATWDYWRGVIAAAEHSTEMLALSALFGIGLALALGAVGGYRLRAILPGCVLRGLRRAMLPAGVLILAWSLKQTCDALQTGPYLAAVLEDRIPPVLFGPLLFVVASMTSFATGTSYGTMGILIPIAIPIAFTLDGNHYGPTTTLCLAAVLDGAIFGDHCSPISDTTILSATASRCDLVAHVRTQLPYSLLVAFVALVLAYVPAALGLPPAVGIGLGVAAMIAVLLSLHPDPRRDRLDARTPPPAP